MGRPRTMNVFRDMTWNRDMIKCGKCGCWQNKQYKQNICINCGQSLLLGSSSPWSKRYVNNRRRK